MEPPENPQPGEESLAAVFEQHESLRLEEQLEAALFASPQPLSVRQLARAFEEPEEKIEQLLATLAAACQARGRGLFLRFTRGGYQLGTKPEHAEALENLLRGLRPRAPLSMPALQTLAIIAYKQPISAPAIQRIRGVEGAGVLTTLRKRKLIAPAGYQPEGHALRYQTTSQFLRDFGLKDLKELPTLPDFAELRHCYEELDPRSRPVKSP